MVYKRKEVNGYVDGKKVAMTVAKVRKIAKEKGISITMVSVSKSYGGLCLEMVELPTEVIKRNLESEGHQNYGNGNTIEVTRLIRKYNRQAKKIVAALIASGVEPIRGRVYGSGEVAYTTRRWTASDELAWNNID